MCGIAGIINLKGSFSAENLQSLVKDMTDQMVHRGPDDSGVWIAPGNHCAFGQRRLSIIDLSPAGHQPMLSADGKAVITFNGEIYNYLELRADLKARGVQFRTQTDTEVLIESLRAWGEGAFAKMDGMYAFALYDDATGEILLARDPFGEKPLYYTQTDEYIAFASELHCLTKLPHFDFRVDDAAIAELLMLQYIHASRTMYRGVKKLPPGHFMRISRDGRISITQHFSFAPQLPPYSNRSIPDLADELQEILIRSIKRRMISDVPLGAFLSGGVDSSLVVALMAKECGREVQTFSIGFAGDKDSEHEFARATAKHLGTNHHEKILAPDVMKLVEHIAQVLDEPNADSSCLPVYLLSEFAREKVTVAISGDGGDELFGGYGRYFATLEEDEKKRAGDPNLAQWAAGETYFGPRICVFSLPQVQRVLRTVPKEAHELIQNFKASLDRGELPLLHRMREIDTRTYMPGAVLAKVDRMSMQHALEVRTPFLSIEVARFAEKLSPEQCYQNGNGKLILKELLCRYLPREFVYRPKQGFGLPTGIWGKESLLPAARKACDTPVARSQYWLPRGRVKRFLNEQAENFSTYQVWNVLMLEMWLRAHRADGVVADIPGAQVSAFEQALLPYRENLPMLEGLSNLKPSAGVYVDVEPPPTYLNRFFGQLQYVELPTSSEGMLDGNKLLQALPADGGNTIVVASGMRRGDFRLMRKLRAKGFRHLLFHDGEAWRSTTLTPLLQGHLVAPIRTATGAITSRVGRFVRRIRLALARRVLNRFAHDLKPLAVVIRPEEGFAWQAQVPQFSEWGNDVGKNQSDLLLFEDETLLAKDAPHFQIREGGGGRYVHWCDSIYFSTTDHSNPLDNGRRYRIIHKPKKTKLLRALWLAPERFFESARGASDALAVWLQDVSFRVQLRNPFSSIKLGDGGTAISPRCRVKTFQEVIKEGATHGVEAIAAKSEGIVFFTSHLGPGGAERQLCYIATSLKERGQKISVLTDSQPIGALGHYLPVLARAGIEASGISCPVAAPELELLIRPETIPDIPLFKVLPEEIRASVQSLYWALMKRRPSVLHCFLDSPNIVGAIAGYLAGVPKIVISARNVNPTNFEYLNNDWYLPWYRLLVTMPSVTFTANSVAGRDSYAEWIGIDPKLIAVIPNAIDMNAFASHSQASSVDVRSQLGLSRTDPIVLGVFRLSHEKRPLLFLQVMNEVRKSVPSLRVLIAGVGMMQQEVEEEIQRLKLSDCVTLLGRRDDVSALMEASNVVALLSENEGSPNVVLEAQALGKPVVCTAVGGSPDIVQDGVTGYLVGKDDKVAMVMRLVELLKTPDAAQKMGGAARSRAVNEFSLEKLTERTLAAYGNFWRAAAGRRTEGAAERATKAVNN